VPVSAPIHVPVELAPADGRGTKDAARIFRLLRSVAVDRLVLGHGLPDEPEWLTGPLHLQFHLPGDPLPVVCAARAAEMIVDIDSDEERAELRALMLEGVPSDAVTRIERYVEERLLQR